MSSARELSIRRGQRIAGMPSFSWAATLPFSCKGFSDSAECFSGVFLEVLRRFFDPPGSAGLYSSQSAGFRSVLFQAS